MRFWDASAVVPLLVAERRSDLVLELKERDGVMLVWWGTMVECCSAVSRLERHGQLDADAAESVIDILRLLASDWYVVQPNTRLRNLALRMLRVHPLRAADSLQLAAALVSADGQPETVEFVSFDADLNAAARREGLRVVTA